MPDAKVSPLLEMIDQAFDHRAWHGTNLKGSIKGVSAREAAWRPSRERHNIWEIVVHLAYWKYTVRRRIRGEKRGSFRLKGSNWFARPVPGGLTEQAWRADVALLLEMHRSMRDTVAGLTPGQLGSTGRGSRFKTRDVVVGVAAHDLYHTGQIQLLKRLLL